MYHSREPPFSNDQIRECSRNSPTIERTRIRSETPGSPGWIEQAPRTMRSMSTPAFDGSVERLDDRDVHDGVELEHDPGLAAGLGVGDLALDQLEEARPQAVRRDEQPAERPLARQAGQDVEQVRDVRADLGAAGEQPEVHVQPGRLRVVVARPDVDVAAQAGALAADDERGLAVRLEPDQAVDDVRAGPLQLARPDDVGLLVEAGLDLDEDDDLLAALGGPDERLDDRRVAGRPVQRLLDRQDVRVVGGLGDEPLDGRGERLVRVVDEDVAGPDGGEDIGRLVVIGRDEAGRRDGRPGRRLEVRPVQVRDRATGR